MTLKIEKPLTSFGLIRDNTTNTIRLTYEGHVFCEMSFAEFIYLIAHPSAVINPPEPVEEPEEVEEYMLGIA